MRYEYAYPTSANHPYQPPIQGERPAFQGTGAREGPAKMGTHHVLVRDGAKERLLLLHRRKGAIHRMARVARQEDNREVDGRDQEDYQIALPYSRTKILKAPVSTGEYIVLSKKIKLHKNDTPKKK